MDLPTLVKQLCIHLGETKEYAKSNKTKSQQVERVSSVLDFALSYLSYLQKAEGGFTKREMLGVY